MIYATPGYTKEDLKYCPTHLGDIVAVTPISNDEIFSLVGVKTNSSQSLTDQERLFRDGLDDGLFYSYDSSAAEGYVSVKSHHVVPFY